jgi:hypothetical protein
VSDQAPSDYPQGFHTVLERQILQEFCAGNISSSEAIEIRSRLAGYAWRDSDSRVVFEAFCRLRDASALTTTELQEQLPAQATRMGFPDVSWEKYFGQDRSEQRGVRDLVDELLAAK